MWNRVICKSCGSENHFANTICHNEECRKKITEEIFRCLDCNKESPRLYNGICYYCFRI